MEEEQIRVENGQAPKAVPFAEMQTDIVPPSMNSIFVPPPELKELKARLETRLETNGIQNPYYEEQEEVEMRSHSPEFTMRRDYDSDEGVAIEGESGSDAPPADSAQVPANVAVTPTQEEVDAALAELDSLPDGTCEAGDVDDEDDDDDDEDEEEWNYYKGTNKVEDEPTSYENVDPPPAFSPSAEFTTMDEPNAKEQVESVTCIQTDLVGSTVFENPPSPTSPMAPSSPRSVEGFVTSVDLNTPEENFCTSFPVNPTSDMTNGIPVVDNGASGPFSVYVSNSPEPQSIEAAPAVAESSLNVECDLMGSQPDTISNNEYDEELTTLQSELVSSVEIVHAQSTVEVITPTSSNTPSEGRPDTPPESEGFPLIMTQSVTGELPEVPYDVTSIDILPRTHPMDLTSDINTAQMSPDVISTVQTFAPPVLDEIPAGYDLLSNHEDLLTLNFDRNTDIIMEEPDVEESIEPMVSNPTENEIPLDIVPQFETVSAPLSEAPHEPLELPVDEFNILDEIKSAKSPQEVSVILDQVVEEQIDEAFENLLRFEYDNVTTPEMDAEITFTMSPAYRESSENLPAPCVEIRDIPLPPQTSQLLEYSPATLVEIDDTPMPQIEAKTLKTEIVECDLVVEPAPQLEIAAPVENVIDNLASLTLKESKLVELPQEPILAEPQEVAFMDKVESVQVTEAVEVEKDPKEEVKPAVRTSIGSAKPAPKPSPRTMANTKAPATKSSPSSATDPKTKRAPLGASKAPRVSSAPPTKSRLATTASRPATSKTTGAASKPAVAAPSKLRSASASAKPATKPTTVTAASRLSAPRTAPATRTTKPSTTTTTNSITKSRISTSTSSTLTKNSSTATRTSTSAKSSPTTPRTTRPIPSTKSATTTNSTRATSTTKPTTERVPLSSRTTTTTKRPTSSVPNVHKSTTTTARTSLSSLSTKSAAAKDPKNVANKAPLTKPGIKSTSTTKSSSATKPRTSLAPASRLATKSAGTKAGAKVSAKDVVANKDAPSVHLSNGMNGTCAEEEENVTIKNEINDQLSSSSPNEIVENSPEEILVNGDH